MSEPPGRGGADQAETRDDLSRAAHEAPTNVARRGRDGLARLLADERPGPSGAAPPAAGDRLGDVVLVDVLGQGGMGVVWRARDATLGRDVAVKVLRQVREAADLARFRAEGEAAARLRHPHVLRVHSAHEHHGHPYLVLDLVEGESLAARLGRTGPFAPRAAVEVARAIASALAHAHERGLVHRDVKPANVLLDADGVPRLADFGLARDLLHDARLTPTGAIVGTPAYMAPEQLTGRTVDARGDVWALGVTLFELLAGRTPFAGLDGPPLLAAMERGPTATGAGAGLDAVLAGCLAFDPEERYASAAALEADLGRWLSGGQLRPPRRRRAWSVATRLLVGAALASLLVLGGVSAGATLSGPAPPGRPSPRDAGPVPPRPLAPVAAADAGPRTRPGSSALSPLSPREACEALGAELRGGDAVDLDAVAAGLAAARRGRVPPQGGFLERAEALAAEVLDARVVKASAAAATTDPIPALSAAARAARLLGVEASASERLARGRVEGLRRAPWGALLAAAIGRHDPRQVASTLADLARAARAEPSLPASARIELARAVRADCAATLGADGTARGGPHPREDPRHDALVALEDGLFYGLAPEAPCGEGLAWIRDELVVGSRILGRERRSLDAAEALQLVRGQLDDSWRHLQAIAGQVEADRAELERRAAAGSAAAHLLLVVPACARASTPAEQALLLPALRACRGATIQDLPPGVAALALARLARTLLVAEGVAARPEVEALAAEALARLADLRTAEGVVSERLGQVCALIVDARAGDAAAVEAAAREGLAVLERQAPFVDTPQETAALLMARAELLGHTTSQLDGLLPDGPGLVAWYDQAEAAAAAAGDLVHQALARRVSRVHRLLAAGRAAEVLRESETCWAALASAVRRIRETAPKAERRRLDQVVRRLAELGARAAEAVGDEASAAAWRARAPG